MGFELLFISFFYIPSIIKTEINYYEKMIILTIIGIQVILEILTVIRYKQSTIDLKNGKYNENIKYRMHVMGRSMSFIRWVLMLFMLGFIEYLPLFVVCIISVFIWNLTKHFEYKIVKLVLIQKRVDKEYIKKITPVIFAGIVITRILTQLYNKLVLSKRPAYLRYEETSLEMYIIVALIIMIMVICMVGVFQVTKYFSGKNAEKRLYLLKISEDEQLYKDTYVKWKEEKNE